MIDFLDMRTLSLVSGLVSMALAAGMVTVYVSHKTYPGFSLWMAGSLCAGIGGVIFCLRGFVPDFFSIILANLLLVLFLSFIVWGLEVFSQRAKSRALDYAVLILSLGLFLFWTYGQENIEARIVVICLAFMFFAGKGAWLLWTDSKTTSFLLLGALLFTVLWNLFRVVVTLSEPWGMADFMTAGNFHATAFIVITLTGTLMVIGLILINHRRTEVDLKQAHSAVRASELRFQKMFTNHHAVMLLVEPEAGRIIEANDAACRYYGYPHEQLLTMAINEINALPPDEVASAMRQALSRQSNCLEFRHKLHDGNIREVEVHSSPIIVNDRTLLFSIIHDITERKQIAEELRISEQKFSLAFHVSTDSININRLSDGIYLDINEGFTTITGYTRDDVLGKSSTEIGIWANSQDRAYLVSELAEKGVVKNLEAAFKAKDGSTLTGLMSASLIEIEGDPCILSFTRDITHRKTTLERLARQQTLLEKSQELGHIGSWDYDLLQDRLRWTEELYRVFNIPPGTELTYALLLGQIHPEDRPSVARHWKDALSGRGYVIEHRLKDTGAPRWVRQKVSLEHDDAGRVTKAIGFAQDITDQKLAENRRLELESQVRQKFKMEAVGMMAGGVAHNFNNNLSIILGNVELCQLHFPQQSEGTSLLENVKTAVLRSRDLVQKLLTYSRKGDQTTRPVQPVPVIEETLTLLRSSIPASVRVHASIAPGCRQATVNADLSQIQEALLNICNNAVYAMEEKGELTIAVTRIELQAQDIPAQYDRKPGEYLRVSVADTGGGIAEGCLERIFDPFFTTKEVTVGTGMGLASVHGIMEKHAGLVTVKSRPDQGATFHLDFPIQAGAPEEAEFVAIEEVRVPVGNGHILFVDDEPMLKELGKKILTLAGYQVIIASNGTEAMRLFREAPDQFDLVISDQTMPGMSGEELIRELLEIRPDLPVVLCTGFSSKLDETKAVELGAKALLMKPLSRPDLLKTTARVLKQAGAT